MPGWREVLGTLSLCAAVWNAATTYQEPELHQCATPVWEFTSGGHRYLYQIHQQIRPWESCIVTSTLPIDYAPELQVREDFLEFFEKNVRSDQLAKCDLLYHNKTTRLYIKWIREDVMKTTSLYNVHCDHVSRRRIGKWDWRRFVLL